MVGDLHRANKISSDLEKEISIIKAKYLKAGYPNGFIDSIINDFHQTKKIFLFHHHYSKSGKKLVFRYHFVKETRTKWNELFVN